MQNSIQQAFAYLKLKDGISDDILKRLISSELVSEEEVEEYKNGETNIILSEIDVENLDIYDSVDLNWVEFDKLSYQEFISALLYGKYFLVVAQSCKWNGSNGYGLYTSMEDALYRGYDVEQIIKEENDKYVELIESSHDVPTGHTSYIISLTTEEYDKVQNWLENMDFEKIDEFISEIVN